MHKWRITNDMWPNPWIATKAWDWDMQFSHHLQPWAARKSGEVILVYNSCSVPCIYSKFPVAREREHKKPAWEEIENAQDGQFPGYSWTRDRIWAVYLLASGLPMPKPRLLLSLLSLACSNTLQFVHISESSSLSFFFFQGLKGLIFQ